MRAFLDTSVLFAAVLSPQGGSRKVLQVGEADVVSLWAGPRVLSEANGVIQRKFPHTLPRLALLLEVSNIQIGPEPDQAGLERALTTIDYVPDAHILAEALAAGADFFITLDRKHFLDNPRVATLPFLLGTPGDFLAHLREELSED